MGKRAHKRRFAWIRYGKTMKEAFHQWAEVAKPNRDVCLRGETALEARQKCGRPNLEKSGGSVQATMPSIVIQPCGR